MSSSFVLLQIEKRKSSIKRVQADIRTVHQLAEETQRRIREDATTHQSQDLETHKTKKTALEEEVAALKKSLQETTANNRETEQKLRKV